MNSHVKGPWQVRKADYEYVVEAENYRIASRIDRKADANLIAAAPELLEVLKQLIDEIPEQGIVTQLTLRDARAAIAKAQGGAE